jgi:KaiC/GvpD/RAD55 family RecA-like ATPase
LTVVVGATGVGKTQLGLQFARAGEPQEGLAGVICDFAARGDSQHHLAYAERMFGWRLTAASHRSGPLPETFFSPDAACGDYLHVFDYRGQRVTRRDLEEDEWRAWQAELNAKLQAAIAFFYGNFVRGRRRVVIDGIEPSDRPRESIQFNLFEYVYHQILRKDPQWVARDLFRENFRRHAEWAQAHAYDPAAIGCLLLCTSRQTLLDDLIASHSEEGDVISNANTLIYLGRLRAAGRVERGLFIAKHRGSACSDEILRYEIGESGLRIAAS